MSNKQVDSQPIEKTQIIDRGNESVSGAGALQHEAIDSAYGPGAEKYNHLFKADSHAGNNTMSAFYQERRKEFAAMEANNPNPTANDVAQIENQREVAMNYNHSNEAGRLDRLESFVAERVRQQELANQKDVTS